MTTGVLVLTIYLIIGLIQSILIKRHEVKQGDYNSKNDVIEQVIVWTIIWPFVTIFLTLTFLGEAIHFLIHVGNKPK
jgi:hypothetical protein